MSLGLNEKTSYNRAWLNLVACRNIPLFGCLYVYMYYWQAKRVLTKGVEWEIRIAALGCVVYIYIYIPPP